MTLTDPFTPPAEPLDPTDPIFPFLVACVSTTRVPRIGPRTESDVEDVRDWGRDGDAEAELGLYERYLFRD